MGNVASQAILPLVARAPSNAGTLPNLDTDLDDKRGRVLDKDSTFSSTSTKRIQRYRLDPAGTFQLNGPSSLLLYAAARDFHHDRVQAQAALARLRPRQRVHHLCHRHGRLHRRQPVHGRDLRLRQSIPQLRDASHHLELWIIVTKASERDMWMAYDTVGYESALTITS